MGGKVLVIAGPTGSGKSTLALILAERFRGGVINADSMQVYRELAVLTARPEARALARAPHFLYGTVPASERYSAGHWRALALEAIAQCQGEGRLPIVAGGTGLYLKALIEGLVRIPPIAEAIRASVRERVARDGAAAAHAQLAGLDPMTAARLAVNDAQRIARALEVFEATGRTLAEWRAGGWGGTREGMTFFVVLIAPPRDALYAACDARFTRMLEAGAVEEVRALLDLSLDPALPAMKALGVREIASYLAGGVSLDEAQAAGQRATRNYVKRQTTWFRHQLSPDLAIDGLIPPIPTGLFDAVDRFLAKAPS